MPKGIPNKKRDEIVVDASFDDAPMTIGRQHGEVKQLLREYTEKARAFFIVDQELSKRAETRTLAKLPTKLLQAANHRTVMNGNGAHATNGHKPRGKYKPRKAKPTYGVGARDKEQLAKTNICGPRLNLFLLEKFDDGEYRTNHWMLKLLKETGKADHIERLSGVYGLLSKEGLLKHDKERGYKRTAAGARFAVTLRTDLEKNGECVTGQYLAPPSYTTVRRVHGFETKQQQRSATH